MQIEGTATISIETLDKLREEAGLAKKLWDAASGITEEIMAVYSFETEAYHDALEKIDNNQRLTDIQITKKISEAMVKYLKIVVDEEALKRLIRSHIDVEESEEHTDIRNATEKELKGIQVVLKGQPERSGHQPDVNLCQICEEYMQDEACEHLEDGSCPAAWIMKRLKEAEKTIKEKEKTIREKNKKIQEIRRQLEESEVKRSYMTDPMAIGDRHEMGG